jgi:hypothetical protein
MQTEHSNEALRAALARTSLLPFPAKTVEGPMQAVGTYDDYSDDAYVDSPYDDYQDYEDAPEDQT